MQREACYGSMVSHPASLKSSRTPTTTNPLVNKGEMTEAILSNAWEGEKVEIMEDAARTGGE
jgi:hypothetical protein